MLLTEPMVFLLQFEDPQHWSSSARILQYVENRQQENTVSRVLGLPSSLFVGYRYTYRECSWLWTLAVIVIIRVTKIRRNNYPESKSPASPS
jgi:hypothetical protein